MIPKSWRIKFFNWLGSGKITLTNETAQEYKPMSTYTIGGGAAGSITLNPSNNMGYGSAPQTAQTMTIKITPASGGTIVQINAQEYIPGELFVIPDGTDFDRELGKIITMSKLKA